MAAVCACAFIAPASAHASHLELTHGFHSHAIHADRRVNTPVSVAVVARDRFLVADYQRLFLLRRVGHGFRARELARPPGLRVWAPTAVDYRRATGDIWLANYTGRDVLRLRMHGRRLRLLRRITNPAMVAPENLAVRRDGALAVTDFDGEALLRFTQEGRLLWRVPVALAHGIAWSGTKLIATSLDDNSVREFDSGGRLLALQGGPGFDVGQHLWPIGVAVQPGRIAVTSAHSGRVTVLGDDLAPKAAVGGNGPGADLFDMPYGITPYGTGFVVADAYKRRLVFLDRQLRAWRELTFLGRDRRGTGLPEVAGVQGNPRVYPTLPITTVFGLQHGLAGYGVILDPDTQQRFLLATTGGLCSHAAGFLPMTYMTWGVVRGGIAMFGSPQQSRLAAIDLRTSAFANVPIPHDSWFIGGRLIARSGRRVDLQGLAVRLGSKFKRIAGLVASGVPRPRALERVLYPQQGRGFGKCLLGDLLMSPAAEPIEQLMRRGEHVNHDVFDQYEAAARSSQPQYLFEEATVRFLAGVQARG